MSLITRRIGRVSLGERYRQSQQGCKKYEEEKDAFGKIVRRRYLLQKMIEMYENLFPHEQAIIYEQVERLHKGQEEYGPWEPGQYDTEKEALEEVMDALNYVADRLVALKEQKNGE